MTNRTQRKSTHTGCSSIAIPLVALVALVFSFAHAALQTPSSAAPPQSSAPAATQTTPTPSQAPAPSSTEPHKHGVPIVALRTTIDQLASIQKRGKLRVGISEIIPWAMHNKDGKWVGFEVDVARKLARDLGVKLEFLPAPLHLLIPDLLQGRTDIIIAGLSIEAHRALEVNFSQPYNTVDVTLAANAKSAAHRETLQDFDKPDMTIGALEESTAEQMAGHTFPNARIKVYDEDSDLFQDLIDGKLNAAIADSPRPELVAKFFPDQVSFPTMPPLSTFPAAFAVRRGDMDFVNFLNSWIASRTANGWLEKRRAYWFKSTDWANDL